MNFLFSQRRDVLLISLLMNLVLNLLKLLISPGGPESPNRRKVLNVTMREDLHESSRYNDINLVVPILPIKVRY